MSIAVYGLDELANVVACMPPDRHQWASEVLERVSEANVAAHDDEYPQHKGEEQSCSWAYVLEASTKIPQPASDAAGATLTLLHYNTRDNNGDPFLADDAWRDLKRLRAEFSLFRRVPLRIAAEELAVIWASVSDSAKPVVAGILEALSVTNVYRIDKLPSRLMAREYASTCEHIVESARDLPVDSELAELLLSFLELGSIGPDGPPLYSAETTRDIHHVRIAVQLGKLLSARVRNETISENCAGS